MGLPNEFKNLRSLNGVDSFILVRSPQKPVAEMLLKNGFIREELGQGFCPKPADEHWLCRYIDGEREVLSCMSHRDWFGKVTKENAEIETLKQAGFISRVHFFVEPQFRVFPAPIHETSIVFDVAKLCLKYGFTIALPRLDYRGGLHFNLTDWLILDPTEEHIKVR